MIVGFCSHLKIAMCFACLVAKKMQEERNKNIDFLNFWARFAGKKMKNTINAEEHMFLFWARFEHDFLFLFLFLFFLKINKLII